MATNLPSQSIKDTGEGTKLYFESYGADPLQFPAVEVDASINFFKKRGFDDSASQTTALTLLKQAKLEGIAIYEVLDTVGKLEALQISALVSEILNNNRVPTSTLGFKTAVDPVTKKRNVRA